MIGLGLSAGLIGLWSAGHCLAMCGGLAIAAGESNRRHLSARPSERATELLAWQLGRVFSYSLIGFLAGSFGAATLALFPVVLLRDLMFAFANLLLIGLGLHVARLYSGVLIVERLGQQIWRLISPLATRTLLPSSQADRRPLRDRLRAIRAGIVWGWLPCGLVYSMLVTAAVSGSGTQGAIWMAGFGLGTIPALWLASLLSQESLRRFQGTGLRRAAGLLIIGFGLWGLLRLSGVITVDWFDSFCIGGQAMGVSLK